MTKTHVVSILSILVLIIALVGCSDDTTTQAQGNQGPTPPTRLTARFVTATQIRLDWTDNASGEDGFDIFEAIGIDSNYIKIATAPKNAEFIYLDGKSSTQKYYFKVRAYSGNGVSGFSQPFMLEGGSMLSKMDIEEGSIRCAVFSPDGSKIATGSGDFKVRLWDWATESVVRTFLYHERAVTYLSFSPGGSRLASSDGIQTVIWDINAGQYYNSFIGTRPKYSPDGRFLIVQIDTLVKLLDPVNFNALHVVERAGAEFCFSADGRWLVTGGDTLRKFDLNSTDDTIRATVREVHYRSLTNSLERISNDRVLAISPEADYLLLGAHYIRLSDFRETVRMQNFTGTCFAISDDGTKLASGTTDWKIIIWNVATGEQKRVLSGHEYSVYSVAWSPNNFFATSASGDGTARVWGPFE